jgi:hypothetical protein
VRAAWALSASVPVGPLRRTPSRLAFHRATRPRHRVFASSVTVLAPDRSRQSAARAADTMSQAPRSRTGCSHCGPHSGRHAAPRARPTVIDRNQVVLADVEHVSYERRSTVDAHAAFASNSTCLTRLATPITRASTVTVDASARLSRRLDPSGSSRKLPAGQLTRISVGRFT